jgi:hypothetical protein
MFGNFNGTWLDQGGVHATIAGDHGTVQVKYTDVQRGPFSGQESEGAISVQFSDANQTIRGVLQDAGQKIAWANGTVWTKQETSAEQLTSILRQSGVEVVAAAVRDAVLRDVQLVALCIDGEPCEGFWYKYEVRCHAQKEAKTVERRLQDLVDGLPEGVSGKVTAQTLDKGLFLFAVTIEWTSSTCSKGQTCEPIKKTVLEEESGWNYNEETYCITRLSRRTWKGCCVKGK